MRTTSYSCQYKINEDDEFSDVVDSNEKTVVSLKRSYTSSCFHIKSKLFLTRSYSNRNICFF